MADAKSTSSKPNGNTSNTTHRTHNDGSSSRAFTAEQKAAVLRVRKCTATSFYSILGLDESQKSTITDSEIKKAYRKLSLLTHPDKNGYDGADEAFKMVSRAFQILSDEDKRKRYDQFGGDPDSRFSSASAANASPFSGFASRGGGMGTRAGGFEEEISPEELFRQFFGGGMGGAFGGGGPFGNGLFDTGPGFVFNLGGMGPGVRVHQFGGNGPRRRPATARGPNDPQPSALDALRNFLPLLLLFLIPILSSLFSGSSSGSNFPSFRYDEPRAPYTHQHTTSRLQTDYFTNPSDVQGYSNSDWKRFDKYVDERLVYSLRHECEVEEREHQRMTQEAMGWFSVDAVKLEEARQLPMRACRRLDRHGLQRMRY